MRSALSEKLEAGRFLTGPYWSKPGELWGAFRIMGPHGTELAIISSGSGAAAEGWEHVSVSTVRRTPSWGEMTFVKSLFWDDEEVVIQIHPKKSQYVSHHPFALHLWRPLDAEIPLPPLEFVGPKVTGPQHD